MSIYKVFFNNDHWKDLPPEIQSEIAKWIRRNQPEAFLFSLKEPEKVLENYPKWFSPARFMSLDGSMMISFACRNLLKIVEVATKMSVCCIEVQGILVDAEFSPEGNRVVVVSSGDSCTPRVWSLNGECLQVFRGHTKEVRMVRFNSDACKIATASEDCTAKLWDAHSGNLLETLTGHKRAVTYIGFNKDSSKIVTISEDTTVRVWDYSGVGLCIIVDETAEIAQFSPDGNSVVIANNNLFTESNTSTQWDISWLGYHTSGRFGNQPLGQALLILLLYACSKDSPLSFEVIAQCNPRISLKEVEQLWFGLDKGIRDAVQSTYRISDLAVILEPFKRKQTIEENKICVKKQK